MSDLIPVVMPDTTYAGRPTVFSPTIVRKLIEAARLGATRTMGCHYAGIGGATLRKWEIQVQTQDPKADDLEAKAQMFDDIEKARAEGSMGWLVRIEKAAEETSQWRAAAWKLERIYARDYGPKGQLEVDANIRTDNTGLEVIRETYDLSRLTDAQLEQLESILDPIKQQVVDVIDGEVRELE